MIDELIERNGNFSYERDVLKNKLNGLDFVIKTSIYKFPRPKKEGHEDTLSFNEKTSSYIANIGIHGYAQKFELMVDGQEPLYEEEISKYLSIPKISEEELQVGK